MHQTTTSDPDHRTHPDHNPIIQLKLDNQLPQGSTRPALRLAARSRDGKQLVHSSRWQLQAVLQHWRADSQEWVGEQRGAPALARQLQHDEMHGLGGAGGSGSAGSGGAAQAVAAFEFAEAALQLPTRPGLFRFLLSFQQQAAVPGGRAGEQE